MVTPTWTLLVELDITWTRESLSVRGLCVSMRCRLAPSGASINKCMGRTCISMYNIRANTYPNRTSQRHPAHHTMLTVDAAREMHAGKSKGYSGYPSGPFAFPHSAAQPGAPARGDRGTRTVYIIRVARVRVGESRRCVYSGPQSTLALPLRA